MPYLNLDLDYFSHPKIVRLTAKIGVEHVAIPIRLWCYVAKYHCEDGMLKGYSKHELEMSLGWTGKSEHLVDALCEIGLLEKIASGFKIHDWKEHAGHLSAFKKRAKTAAKKRWNRYASSIAKTVITNAPNLPNHTIPTIPTRPKKKSDRADRLDRLETFVVSDETRTWARNHHGVEIPEHVVKEFKEYWRDKKTLRTDWDTTFRSRIDQLVGWKTLQPSRPSGTAPQQKCAWTNDEPCQDYAIAGSRYCASHKERLLKIQQRNQAMPANAAGMIEKIGKAMP